MPFANIIEDRKEISILHMIAGTLSFKLTRWTNAISEYNLSVNMNQRLFFARNFHRGYFSNPPGELTDIFPNKMPLLATLFHPADTEEKIRNMTCVVSVCFLDF